MAGKNIITYYKNGNLYASYPTGLSISVDYAEAATVRFYTGPATITNSGRVSEGVDLRAGGALTNRATGYVGYFDSAGGYGSLVNTGTVASVYLADGGGLLNSGSSGNVTIAGGGRVSNLGKLRRVTIAGGGYVDNMLATIPYDVYVAGGGTVINTGTVVGGATLANGGAVRNGALSATKAAIEADVSVSGAAATVTNFGAIAGVLLDAGGTVANGAATDTTAAISIGIAVTGAAASISNFGTIVNANELAGDGGVVFRDGGAITNGAEDSGAALIEGYDGAEAIGKPMTITNFATIEGDASGVYLAAGGVVANGGPENDLALIEGRNGLLAAFKSALVTNAATIMGAGVSGSAGIRLAAGGTVVNEGGGRILGYTGVSAAQPTAITNLGMIQGLGTTFLTAGVYLGAGGAVTNQTGGLIEGGSGIRTGHMAATVTNFGSIKGLVVNAFSAGVYLNWGGSIDNELGGLIEGEQGVRANTRAATVVNDGSIVATAATGSGVRLSDGGRVTNGAPRNVMALITGYCGVRSESATATVNNYGTISGVGSGRDSAGVYVARGGAIVNGASMYQTGLIEGYCGVRTRYEAATVSNFGTIRGAAKPSADGVYLVAGGVVANGSAGAIKSTALIAGANGVVGVGAAPTTIVNFGSISALGAGAGNAGVNLLAGGVITNGDADDVGAIIQGVGFGVRVSKAGASLVNFGTVRGTGASGIGVASNGGGVVTNGSAQDRTSLIQGYSGIVGASTLTVTNFGTIEGDGGYAILFKSDGSTLVVEAGSVFKGAVQGDGGTLVLAPTLSVGLFSTGDSVEVIGGIATTTFHNFGVVKATTIALSGTQTVGSAVDVLGTASLTGTIVVKSLITGPGLLDITGGATTLDEGASLSVDRVDISGAATELDFDTSLSFGGDWSQTDAAVTLGGNDFDLTGPDSLIAAVIDDAGTLATHAAVKLGGLTLGGAAVWENYGAATETAALTLGNAVSGAAALINEATGAFDMTTNAGIAAAGAGGAIVNHGVLEKTGGTGTSVIAAAVTNAVGAAIEVSSGTLKFMAAVGGGGAATIAGGTLWFDSTFAEDVDFSGTSGTLELADSRAYTGTIAGFSTSGGTALDLADIEFIAGTTRATFAGTATGGVLTVTDGTHTAMIHLSGDYLASTWTSSAAAGGGTLIVDPSDTRAAAHHRHIAAPAAPIFVQAIAGLATTAAAAGHAADVWRPPRPPAIGPPRVSA